MDTPEDTDRGGSDILAAAARLFANRAYADAAELYRTALDDRDIQGRPRATVLLDLAGSLDRAGSVAAAWQYCQQAADYARAAGDGALLADAATKIRSVSDRQITGQIHELCVEALAALPPDERIRRGRVQAVQTATASRWARPVQPLTADSDDPESRFRDLQALYAERLGAQFVHDRLDIADLAVSLGRRVGSSEYAAWGLVWRIDALAQLGDRIAMEAELAVLDQVAGRMSEPQWNARLLRIRSMLKLSDGRLDESRELSDQALNCCPNEPWEQYFHLVVDAHLAVFSGVGLADVESRVRVAIEDAPFFARGWLAGILLAQGRNEEASVIWRAIAPHVRELPHGALESFIAQAGNARLCVLLGDRETAPAVFAELLPFADLWVCARADGPSDGPVQLHLGRLSLLTGDLADAEARIAESLLLSESVYALPFVADSHLALAEIYFARSRVERSEQDAQVAVREAELARDQARRLGLGSLATRAQTLLDAHRPRRTAILTDREDQVVALIAEGLSNRLIAQRLQLSERTVENHVSHVLTKTGHSSRAGIAGWYTTVNK